MLDSFLKAMQYPRSSSGFSTPCRRPSFCSSQSGFTLLELLVVLAIVGLISAVAVPQLSNLSARVEFALNREKLEQALRLLPYEAFKRKEDLVLGKIVTEVIDDGSADLMQVQMIDAEPTSTVTIERPALLAPAQLPLPPGWTVEAKKPIIYRATGLCSGGTVNVNVDDLLFVYELSSPRCEPIEK